MSKVTILEWLELKRSEVYKDSIYQNHGSLSGLARKELEIIDAIRTAIVRLGGCTKRAVEIMDDAEKLDHETWEEVVMEFLEDIRDFGEEGK